MATVYQRKGSNIYYYRFKYQGKQYNASTYQTNKTAAQHVLANKMREAKEAFNNKLMGIPDAPELLESPLFENIADEYLDYYKANRRPNSSERHEMSLRALKDFFVGKYLTEIDPLLIEKYKQIRKQRGRSGVTINRELAFLKNMFTMAITWSKASENPVKQVRLFREDNGRTRYLTDDEESRLLSQCGPYLLPIVFTALHTGMRKEELLSLRWASVNFQQRLITVESAYSKNHHTRSIDMSEPLTETLQGIRVEDPQAAVFLNSRGTPYRDISTAFRTAVRKAAITNCRFHDLRHTFASRLVMAGTDIRTVQELLGHKTLSQTMRYAHLAPGHTRQAIMSVFNSRNSGYTCGYTQYNANNVRP